MHTDAACTTLSALGADLATGVWLSPEQAWQAELNNCPANALETLRQQADGWAVDINIIRAEHQRKRLLIADMDSTMIEQECIDEMAEAAGAGEAVRAITRRAMNGELDFEDALRERVTVLKDLPAKVIAEVIANRISLMSGGAQLVATMRKHGAYCALVSGGFTHFTEHVSQILGFHEHQANQLLIKNGQLTGAVTEPILGRNAKVTSLNRICGKLGIEPTLALTVGDGANDVPMLQAAGLGVAMHAKPVVKKDVAVQIDHGDLTALLFLQGFTPREFANLA